VGSLLITSSSQFAGEVLSQPSFGTGVDLARNRLGSNTPTLVSSCEMIDRRGEEPEQDVVLEMEEAMEGRRDA